MTCCLDPACHNPPNPDDVMHCSNCGGLLITLRNRYRPIELIGGGGFGKTYLAEDIDKLNEHCVIKQFAPQVQGTGALKKATELFEQEAKRLQQLGKHPQIPTLLAYFNEDKRLYLVQEFIEGQNLLKELQQQRHFTEEKVRELLLDLLDILKTVHQHKVIHRDIKPENIIRHNSGKLVLIDFGASKQLTATVITQGGTNIGSFGYAPMEQMQGGEAHPASDLYSVGATCFHLLSGIHPWELWKRQGYGWVASWRQHLPQEVSQEFGQMLDKLLQEESHQRYESVEELLQDLNPPPKPSITKIQPDFVDLPPTQLPVNPQPILYPPSAPPAIPSKAQAPITGISDEPSGNSKVSPQPAKNAKLATQLLLGVAITLVGLQIYNYVRDRLFPANPVIANVSELASKASKLFLENVLKGYSNYNLPSPVAISQDGKILACSSGNKNSNIKLWDIGTGKEILTLPGHSESVRSVAFNPDGKILASGSDNKNSNIKLWDIGTGKEILILPGHSESVRSLAFSPDGKILSSGSGERNSNINHIKLWDIATGKLINILEGHKAQVNSVVFRQDGKTLVSGSRDKTIKVWNLTTGEEILTLEDDYGVNSVAISRDGKTLASGNMDNTIKIWWLP